jgi:flagellar biogenesis protein FliO
MKRQCTAFGVVLTILLLCSGFLSGAARVDARSVSSPAVKQHAERVVATGSTRPEAQAMAANTAPAGAQSSTHASRPSAKLDVAPYAMPASSAPLSFDGGSLLMLGAKFAIVLVLLFACLRVLKLVMPGGRKPGLGKPNPMVLHTESLGDKHRVCLLDLGKSIVVVGISASGVSPITTIDGAAEVERLRGRYAHGRSGLATQYDIAPAENTSFSAELADAETLEEHGAADRQADISAPVLAQVRVPARPVVRLQSVARKRFAPVPEPPAGDPDLSRAVDRLRDLRRRIERA